MKYLMPNTGKIILPIILIILALIPSFLIRVFVFETLALPLGKSLEPFREADKHFLNPCGVIIVALIWAMMFYILACIIAFLRNKV
jgi:hypothetical protein